MFINNETTGAKNNNSRKRRNMKEPDSDPSLLIPYTRAAPNNFFPSGYQSSSSQVQRILNAAATPVKVKPFSFLSLLTAPDPDPDDICHNSLSIDIKNQIEHTIMLHGENLKQTVMGVLEKNHRDLRHVVEERATKKLKEKEVELFANLTRNAELEKMVEDYETEVEWLSDRVRCLERTRTSLRMGLREARAARQDAETVEDDAGSSLVDPDRVGARVRLDCTLCETEVAKVMMWPCRHVCVCALCDPIVKVCPVCRTLKIASLKVYFPSN